MMSIGEADDVRALTDIGFIALAYGSFDRAAAIFEGVQAARPAQEAGFIGRALVHLSQSQTETAIKMLRGLPPSDAAQTYLALALYRHGEEDEARAILSDIVQTDSRHGQRKSGGRHSSGNGRRKRLFN